MTGNQQHAPPEGYRSLAEVIAAEAPVASRRATAIALAVVDELVQIGTQGRLPGRFSTFQVQVGADGSVVIAPETDTTRERSDPDHGLLLDSPSEAGASVGVLLFELIMARPPLGANDVFEPAITTVVPPTLTALMVRSCSEFASQWPTVAEWSEALRATSGGSVTPVSPVRRAKHRRQRLIAVLVVILLAAISIATIVLAPRWWNGATADQSSAGPISTIESVSVIASQPFLAMS